MKEVLMLAPQKKKIFSKGLTILLCISLLFLISHDSFPLQEKSQKDEALSLSEEGWEAYKNGEYRQAIELYSRAFALAKDKRLRENILFGLSLCYFALGEEENSKEWVRILLKTNPEFQLEEKVCPPKYIKLFNELRKEIPGAIEKPKAIEKPVEKRPKKTGKRIIFVAIGALVAGGVIYFLLSKKEKKEETGSIDVKSTPQGARVYLDGSDTGRVTDTILTGVKVGSHTVTLKLAGFKDYTTTVSVYKGWTSYVNCILESIFEFVTKWGSEGSGDGQFRYPYGVAVDSSGYVYVADYYNYRIQKFRTR